MSQIDIVHLEAYRERRESRFRRARALCGHDLEQAEVLEHLWRAISLVGADRGAVVWLDEYGPGLAHPHAILDLGADRPRRCFSPIPLRAAWETRVPGLLDLPQTGGRWERMGEGISSACVVALGSDGPRSWFLVLDSLTPRGPLGDRVAGDLMFLAGEVASVVLHRDLGLGHRAGGPRRSGYLAAGVNTCPGSFAGSAILEDLGDRRCDQALSWRIRNRFLVARVVRGLVEDHLVVDGDALAKHVDRVRVEIGVSDPGDAEDRIWDRVLRAAAAPDTGELLAAVLEWGRVVDGHGHLRGALEIFGLAFELAKATGSSDGATDAARFQAKVFRTRADWDRAIFWYGVARRVAEESGDWRRLAAVMDGQANAYRDRGNLPRAREILLDVLEIGEETGDRYAKAIAHHDLMTVEKLRGHLVEGIRHGWLAVQSYDSRDGRLRALFDLAGVLRESGELSAAWDAYSVVADQVDGLEARVLALDALAFVAALKGDRAAHDRLRRRLEAVGWEEVSPVYRGQVLYYRGLSSLALGDEADGRAWLEKALIFAEDCGLNKLIFDAEAALRDTDSTSAASASESMYRDSIPEEILGVRQGLREMREAPAGAGDFS